MPVQGSLDLGRPGRPDQPSPDRSHLAPRRGVTRLDVCKTIETPARRGPDRAHDHGHGWSNAVPRRTRRSTSSSATASPVPPDDIIEPVLATYERWMELNTASALDPTADATELYELSSRRGGGGLPAAQRADSPRPVGTSRFDPAAQPRSSRIHRPDDGRSGGRRSATRSRTDRGIFDADRNAESRAPNPETLEQVERRSCDATTVRVAPGWIGEHRGRVMVHRRAP